MSILHWGNLKNHGNISGKNCIFPKIFPFFPMGKFGEKKCPQTSGRLLLVNTVRFMHVTNIFCPGKNHEKNTDFFQNFSKWEYFLSKWPNYLPKLFSFWENLDEKIRIFLNFLKNRKSAKTLLKINTFGSFKLNYKEMHRTFGVRSKSSKLLIDWVIVLFLCFLSPSF